ncbi:MAG: hypothetical protein HKL85_13170 [Acidimicrobiaceae bacterium]|nr:hypothetical protein [Acidimicrobiaceae bacterium]
MSEMRIPIDGSPESNAVDKVIQTAWDRFAAFDGLESVADQQHGETHVPSLSDEDG